MSNVENQLGSYWKHIGRLQPVALSRPEATCIHMDTARLTSGQQSLYVLILNVIDPSPACIIPLTPGVRSNYDNGTLPTSPWPSWLTYTRTAAAADTGRLPGQRNHMIDWGEAGSLKVILSFKGS